MANAEAYDTISRSSVHLCRAIVALKFNQEVIVNIKGMSFGDWEALRAKYLEALFVGTTPPKSPVFLATAMPFTSRPYAVFAFRLWQGKTVRQLAKAMREAVDDEQKHDGPEVMNMIGILDTCLKNSKCLKQMASKMPDRMKKALAAVSAEYEGLLTDPVKAFEQIFALS